MIQYKKIVQIILAVIIIIIGPDPEWKKFANIKEEIIKLKILVFLFSFSKLLIKKKQNNGIKT